MADDKKGRDKQARDAENRQQRRDMEEARERGDEAEPVEDDPEGELGELDEALESEEYPATADELVDAHGDREVESRDGWRPLEEVFESVDDDETYESADDARARILGLIRR